MNKKFGYLFLPLFGCVCAFTSGCGNTDISSYISDSGNSSVQEKITLRFWNGFTGADGDGMMDIVNDFNSTYEGRIEVAVDELSWDALFLKLIQNKSNPKFSPHIVAMGANHLSSMKSKGLLRPLDGIETYLGISGDDFLPAAWNAGLLGDTTRYSFPLDMHPVGMYYNKDLIDESELPATWNDFIEVCKEKTDPTTGVYGWAIPNMYSITKDIFYSMLVQSGLDILDANNQPIFNSATGVEWLSKMFGWKYSDRISPSSVGASGDLTLFEQGKSVFYFDGPWMINTINDTSNIEFGVAPMPNSVGEGGTSFSGSHQLTCVASTVTDQATLEACYTFINYVSENSLRWAQAGQVPARLDIHSLPEYQALTNLRAFTEQAETATLGNMDYKYFYEAYNYMGSAVANSLNNVKTPQASLDEKANQFKLFVTENE